MPARDAQSGGGRTRARELLVQALYQKQLAGHDLGELLAQFREQGAYERVDQPYFEESLKDICRSQPALEQVIAGIVDRPIEQLDPVERAILLIGVYELETRIEVPYRVVINEGVNLARRFGATDGHKYINACLDHAARSLRSVEIEAKGRG